MCKNQIIICSLIIIIISFIVIIINICVVKIIFLIPYNHVFGFANIYSSDNDNNDDDVNDVNGQKKQKQILSKRSTKASLLFATCSFCSIFSKKFTIFGWKPPLKSDQ